VDSQFTKFNIIIIIARPTDTVPAYAVDNKLSYGEIVVPTFDSIRMKYLKRMLLMNKKHVLSPGPTGTGKTVNINELLT